ncbi:MAG: PhzF family phenazine biosynthesis protein [Chlamydiae bacterium]|nr:PhzF family phenazine biosynthesis protein [Chlamydiota bacterium]MBI3265735.1 PhzF family phenazine biosynthesis protein [Chlamydiota bacterium]
MIKIFHVDAFASQPFQGNPAAVCILNEAREEKWMQSLAREMNLSETAFLWQEGDVYRLRWFTPQVEVDLCGHATLASAHVLWEEKILASYEEARFQTRSGLLTAFKKDAWIEMNFPAEKESLAQAPASLIKGLGVKPKYVGRNRMDYLVELDSEESVRNLKPDFSILAQVETRVVIVTSLSSSQKYDFVSRCFGPRVGILEDPVTGSAHCCLGPFWKKRLGKNELMGYQTSSRGGFVGVRVAGDRVYLRGQAVTVARGEVNV